MVSVPIPEKRSRSSGTRLPGMSWRTILACFARVPGEEDGEGRRLPVQRALRFLPAAVISGQPRALRRAVAEYSKGTHQDEHSLLVDYDIFVKVQKLDARDLKKVQQVYKAEDSDFRLKPGSAAVDKGVAIPNITDGFAGQAPDLGALELGQAPPHYGPRQ